MNASTALAAVEAGARIVNDVSGGLADPDMLAAVAGTDADVVLGHWRGPSADMYARAEYADVVHEVLARARASASRRPRRPASRPLGVIVDPGIGFGKKGEQNWATLRGAAAADRPRPPRARRHEPQALPRRGAATDGCRGPDGRPRSAATSRPPSRACWPRRRAPGRCACTTSPRPGTPCASRRAGRERADGLRRRDHPDRAARLRTPRRVRRRAAGRPGLRRRLHALRRHAPRRRDRRRRRHRALRRGGRAIAAIVGGEPVESARDARRSASPTPCWPTTACGWSRVTVHKPDAPIALPFADVSVTIVATPPSDERTCRA